MTLITIEVSNLLVVVDVLAQVFANLQVTEGALTDLVNQCPAFSLLAQTEAALCLVEQYVCITLEVDVVGQPEHTC